MKIALCQINTTVGDLDFNKEDILRYYSNSIKINADIVVYPELTITGYPPQDLLLENGFVEDNLNILQEIAAQSTIPMIVGFVRKENDKLYNSAALCQNGKVTNTYDKMLLPTYDVFDEDRYFENGKVLGIWKLIINGKKINLGIQICEDLWDREYDTKVSKLQKDKGADFIINISASPYHEGRIAERQELIKEKVKDIKIPFLYCNLIGGQDELIFDGESRAFNANCEQIAQGKVFEEDLMIVDIESTTKMKYPNISNEEKLYNALCLGVKDYFRKTGHTDALIGLSGGIDSAIVACIAADALGAERVHGVSMPSLFSSGHSKSDAKQLADNLKIKYDSIAIQNVVNSFETALKEQFEGTIRNVAEENIQARTRGNILMAISNKFGWMVLSTGNKTEIAVGDCTLYGDMSGGLSVISDLSKVDVYRVSRWVNEVAGYDRIPQSTIDKAPSAELSEDQVDPFDYDIVSPLVDEIIEGRKSPKELIENGADKELVMKLYRLIRINEFKRRQAAPGLRVSSKAFGVGRRVPIVNHYQGKLV
ncbi:MAG: NAD+ synthase [Candidatus Marinimicrobia bacterium]|nr:NAD+ synthase [Candidatus Neomarinimicrobiota bacterium]